MVTKPFNLPSLPPELNLLALFKEALDARTALGELNGRVKDLHEPGLLVTPLLTKEAERSSRIEGTQVTLEDVFEYEAAEKKPQTNEKERDSREILNYREAMRVAIDELNERPFISESLIKKIHFVLLDSVRGENKDRGNLRRMEVYIGQRGISRDKATYIPPLPADLPFLLTNWENYINSNDQMDMLIQIGVAHYQFEAIHPFMDGNGRIGRLLIPLFFYQRGLLTHPVLYISEYFEKNHRDYYDLLNGVSSKGDWESWLRFFLVGVSVQARKSQGTIDKIFDLYNEMKSAIGGFGSGYAIDLLDILFAEPVVSFPTLKRKIPKANHQTIYNLIDKFAKSGIIEENSDRKRNKQYRFGRLLEIIE